MAEERRKGETVLEILISITLLSIFVVCVFSSYLFLRRIAAKGENYINIESLCLDIDKYYDYSTFDTRYSESELLVATDDSYIGEKVERTWAQNCFKYDHSKTADDEPIEKEINIHNLLTTIENGKVEKEEDETDAAFEARKDAAEAAAEIAKTELEKLKKEFGYDNLSEDEKKAFDKYQQNERYQFEHYFDEQLKEVETKDEASYILVYEYEIEHIYKNGEYVATYNLVVNITDTNGVVIIEDLNYGKGGGRVS